MKKVKSGIAFLVLGTLVLTGCDKLNHSTKSSQTDTAASAVAKNNINQSSDSAKTVSTNTKPTDDHNFNLMVKRVQLQIPRTKKKFADTYKDITITSGNDHTIVYTYTFLKNSIPHIDSNKLKPMVAEDLKSSMDRVKSAVPDIKFQVIYLNADGSEIGNVVVTQADTDAVK